MRTTDDRSEIVTTKSPTNANVIDNHSYFDKIHPSSLIATSPDMESHTQPLPTANTPPETGRHQRLDSGEILKGANTVEIAHAGQCYLLRVTRENKLILTK